PGGAALRRRPRRRDPRGRGDPHRDAVRAQRRGRREPRARGGHGSRRRGRGRRGAGGGVAGPGRMTDWDRLARPSLRGLERYDPGPTRDALRAQHGLEALEPLNWNEDRFGPPQAALDAAAAELRNAPLYPERAYADFREAVAASLGATPGHVVPAHGAQ